MSDRVQTTFSELYPLIEETLARGDSVRLSPAGRSMWPMLRGNRDYVILRRPDRPFRRGDVLLYRRRSGQFVLHRVVGVTDEGLIMRGDNQHVKESGLSPSQVLAIMTSFSHGRRHCKAGGLTDRWYAFMAPAYHLLSRIRGRCKRLWHRRSPDPEA